MYEEGVAFDVSVLGIFLWALGVFDVVDIGVRFVIHVVNEGTLGQSESS
jgi:hypothetical protein